MLAWLTCHSTEQLETGLLLKTFLQSISIYLTFQSGSFTVPKTLLNVHPVLCAADAAVAAGPHPLLA